MLWRSASKLGNKLSPWHGASSSLSWSCFVHIIPKVPMYTLSLQHCSTLKNPKDHLVKTFTQSSYHLEQRSPAFWMDFVGEQKVASFKSILCLVTSKKTQAIGIHEVANKDSYLNVPDFSSFKMTQFLHGQWGWGWISGQFQCLTFIVYFIPIIIT